MSGTIGVSQDQTLICFEPGAASRVDGHIYKDDKSGTIRANAGDNQQAVVYGISPYDSNAMKSANPHSGIYEADTSRTLDLNGGSPACNQGGMAVVCLEGNGQRESHKGDGYKESETMYTLNTVEQHGVMLFEPRSQDGVPRIYENRVCPTLNTAQGGQRQPCIVDDSISYQETVGTLSPGAHAGSYNGQDAYNDMLIVDNSQEPITMTTEMTPKIDDNGIGFSLRSRDYKDPPVVTYGLDRASFNQGKNAQFDFSIEKEKIGSQLSRGPGAVCASVVRRLTPMECERLQGFPDHWTDIGEWIDSKGKKHKDADSPRYKALGNSIALPFWGWLAERIVAQYDRKTTMASLFDGIGGFPLVFSRCGCEPIWASEIEEFPIAVTKLRFPDKEKPYD